MVKLISTLHCGLQTILFSHNVTYISKGYFQQECLRKLHNYADCEYLKIMKSIQLH